MEEAMEAMEARKARRRKRALDFAEKEEARKERRRKQALDFAEKEKARNAREAEELAAAKAREAELRRKRLEEDVRLILAVGFPEWLANQKEKKEKLDWLFAGGKEEEWEEEKQRRREQLKKQLEKERKKDAAEVRAGMEQWSMDNMEAEKWLKEKSKEKQSQQRHDPYLKMNRDPPKQEFKGERDAPPPTSTWGKNAKCNACSAMHWYAMYTMPCNVCNPMYV